MTVRASCGRGWCPKLKLQGLEEAGVGAGVEAAVVFVSWAWTEEKKSISKKEIKKEFIVIKNKFLILRRSISNIRMHMPLHRAKALRRIKRC